MRRFELAVDIDGVDLLPDPADRHPDQVAIELEIELDMTISSKPGWGCLTGGISATPKPIISECSSLHQKQ